MLTQKQIGNKIRDLRQSLGLSQEQLAKKISLSRAAFSQLEIGKRNVNAIELAKLADFFKISMDSFLRNEESANLKRASKKPVKKFKFNENKLKNLILYILAECGGKPNLGETVLYKLLYFCDFNAYEITGKPITGMNYVKLQYGPVPQAGEYNGVINKMIKNNELKIISQNYHGLAQKRYIAMINTDVSVFKTRELEIVNNLINRLSNMNAKQIEDYVHEDAPWKISRENEVISYDAVIDRQPPYAQIDHWLMWQDAAAEDILKDLGPMSDEETAYYHNPDNFKKYA